MKGSKDDSDSQEGSKDSNLKLSVLLRRDAAQNRLLCGSGDFDKTIAELTATMRDVEQKLRQLKVKETK